MSNYCLRSKKLVTMLKYSSHEIEFWHLNKIKSTVKKQSMCESFHNLIAFSKGWLLLFAGVLCRSLIVESISKVKAEKMAINKTEESYVEKQLEANLSAMLEIAQFEKRIKIWTIATSIFVEKRSFTVTTKTIMVVQRVKKVTMATISGDRGSSWIWDR